jgi:ATP-binding cassette subfamily B protein
METINDLQEHATIRQHCHALWRALRIIHTRLPWYLTLTITSQFISAIQPLAILFFSARLLDELSTTREIPSILLWAMLAVGVVFVSNVARVFIDRKVEKITSNNSGAMLEIKLLRHEKFSKMDYEYAENAQIREIMERTFAYENWNNYALTHVFYAFPRMVGLLFSLVGSLILIGGLLGELAQSMLGITLLFLPLIPIVMSAIFTRLNARLTAKAMASMPKVNNLCNHYLGEYILINGAALDIRLYRQQKLILDVVARSRFPAMVKLYAKMACVPSALGAFTHALIGGVAYIAVGLRALGGALGIGQVTQYVGAITTFTSSLSSFAQCMEDLVGNTRYLLLLYDFLDLPAVKYQGTLTTEKRSDNAYALEFRDVSFKYPGSDVWALRHVNLKLQMGRKLAVVGMNGSGKSTMIKLLCRLYDPTEGEITLNGIDVRKYDLREYMDLFAVTFQDYSLAAFPLGQNVATSMDYDADRVRETLQQVGFTHEMTLETALYKEFDEDGVYISGGEAQKIALARALYRDAPMIILDEPTAALDPIAEADIYSKFDGIVENRTAVYISHRLSSCRFCDDIAVFDHGELIQRGSHDRLLDNTDGKYHEMWNAQAQWYA